MIKGYVIKISDIEGGFDRGYSYECKRTKKEAESYRDEALQEHFSFKPSGKWEARIEKAKLGECKYCKKLTLIEEAPICERCSNIQSEVSNDAREDNKNES